MIRYFTGTGNTRAVAERLASKLGESIASFTAAELRAPATAVIETDSNLCIWAFPTYSWGVPPVIANLIKACSFGTAAMQARHIMLTTCGDDMALANKQFQTLIEERGLIYGGCYAVAMPNNYVCLPGFDVDGKELERIKLKAYPDAVERVARAISTGAGDILIRLSFSWLKSKVIYPGFAKHYITAKPFHVTDDCISCGKCWSTCPMENISSDADKRPLWGAVCAGCLRCYHICPRHAVRYGSATDSKGQYMLPEQ